MPKIIPFYGARDRRLFEIERRCMDRDGRVIRRLDAVLPAGSVLDVGAGDGFTAQRLTTSGRTVVPLEPARGMMAPERRLPWVQGAAQDLPFRVGSFAGAYATWAYFFPTMGHGDPGLSELHRVVRPGGPIAIVDNAGDDDFSSWSDDQDAFASDPVWWAARGFAREIVETSFRFDTVAELRELFTLYFGERGRQASRLEVGYRVAIYRSGSLGEL